MRSALLLVLVAACADPGEPLDGRAEAFTDRFPDDYDLLPFYGPYGSFYASDPLFCDPGRWVQGFKLKVERKQGDGDDTALNAIAFRCRDEDGAHTDWFEVGEGTWGGWSDSWHSCSGDGNFVKGARFRIEGKQGKGDDTGANDLQLACREGGFIKQDNGLDYGSWTAWQFCPDDSFVCGMWPQVERGQGGGDDTALNGGILYCCPL